MKCFAAHWFRNADLNYHCYNIAHSGFIIAFIGPIALRATLRLLKFAIAGFQSFFIGLHTWVSMRLWSCLAAAFVSGGHKFPTLDLTVFDELLLYYKKRANQQSSCLSSPTTFVHERCTPHRRFSLRTDCAIRHVVRCAPLLRLWDLPLSSSTALCSGNGGLQPISSSRGATLTIIN